MKSHAINTPSKGNREVHTKDHVPGSSHKMVVHFEEGSFLMLR